MSARPDYDLEEEELFAAVLALPVSERTAYLKRACGTNAALLERLTNLVEDFSKAGTFFNEDPIRAWDSVERIGPYRLVRELGEGGCGIAYLAEQTNPIRREVAIKVIKPGMDTKAVIARFEAERQALALMDHPNVAKVFDAGATAEGRPYFVMELVRGVKITEYCTQSRLSVAERLSLFVQVCEAIQHAHQKGIIHRDIKPSNVLVTVRDGLPVVKVIDFGIAKAIQGRLTDQTIHTELGRIIGTPAYISPEQTDASDVGVDTRSDIYSLGVLLYELLTGQTPFDADELSRASLDQLRERLRLVDPPRPSRRLQTLDADLDWIVMRCLEKEATRRYQAVTALSEDLDRYLRNEPVLARPPSVIYSVRKLARRNRVAFASATTFIVLVTLSAIGMTIQAQRIGAQRDVAERERLKAQQVANVAMNVFAVADPYSTLTSQVSASALLEQAARSVERELRDQPHARASLLHALSRNYIRRGRSAIAIGHLREAVDILRRMPGAETETLGAMVDLATALRRNGDIFGSQRMSADGYAFAKRYGLERTAEYAYLLLDNGRTQLRQGQTLAAQSSIERSLQLYRALPEKRPIEIAVALNDLALVLTWADQFARAEQTAREALELLARNAPPMHPDRVSTEMYLADALFFQGRGSEAIPLLQAALSKAAELFGPDCGTAVSIVDRLAEISYAQGNLVAAEAYSRDALARARRDGSEGFAGAAEAATTLARTLLARGEFAEAEVVLRRAIAVLARALPPSNQSSASAEYFLGELLLATNRLTEAEAVLTASMNRWKSTDAPPWRAMRSANALGEALYRQGRTAEGAKYLVESMEGLAAAPSIDREAQDKARARAEHYLRTTVASQ
ncbi:MAG TPA: protein kinase [Steroidobacteraceae bacterium]|jgi:serine/threonine protein kinase